MENIFPFCGHADSSMCLWNAFSRTNMRAPSMGLNFALRQ
jgi:hypothetical protein